MTDFFRYSKSDFMFVRSWLSCVFFTGGVTIGNIGRQLASVSIDWHICSFLHKKLNVFKIQDPYIWTFIKKIFHLSKPLIVLKKV